MSKTLYYGSRHQIEASLLARIDRHVTRRHTHAGFDRCMELAAQDFARHVAAEVSPQMGQATLPSVTFAERSAVFGRRMKFLNGE